MGCDDCEPVGLVEIAELLGVERSTLDVWKNRGRLPEPRWRASGSPLWDRADVIAWAKETGRL